MAWKNLFNICDFYYNSIQIKRNLKKLNFFPNEFSTNSIGSWKVYKLKIYSLFY